MAQVTQAHNAVSSSPATVDKGEHNVTPSSLLPIVRLYDDDVYFLHTTLLPRSNQRMNDGTLHHTPATYRAHHIVNRQRHRVEVDDESKSKEHSHTTTSITTPSPSHIAAAWVDKTHLLVSSTPALEAEAKHVARQMCHRPEDRGAMSVIHIPSLGAKDMTQAAEGIESTALTGLPFDSFSGIVRDYTAMNLARHNDTINTLWQAYTTLHSSQSDAEQSKERSETAAVKAPANKVYLTHRFIVTSAAQHAIWAIEVKLPARRQGECSTHVEDSDMLTHSSSCNSEDDEGKTDTDKLQRQRPLVRVVSPAEFFASSSTNVALRDISSAHSQGILTAEVEGVEPTTSHAEHMMESGSSTPLPRRRIGPLLTPTPEKPTTRPKAESEGVAEDLSHSADKTPLLQHPDTVQTARPLMGGVAGFVDGVFSVARFRGPTALCWRMDDSTDGTTPATNNETHMPSVTSMAEQMTCWRDCTCAVLFISDTGNHAIRYANFASGVVRTIAGLGGGPGYRDGACAASALAQATSLAWGSSGLFFSDGPNHALRLITGIGKHQERSVTHPPLQPKTEIGDTEENTEHDKPKGTVAPIASSSEEPRVWTVAGGDVTSNSGTSELAVRKEECYLDAAEPQQARFGQLTCVMPYRADCLLATSNETTLPKSAACVLLLVDSTCRAVRVLDASGVRTLVNITDFTSDEGVEEEEQCQAPAALMVGPAVVLACRAPAQLRASRPSHDAAGSHKIHETSSTEALLLIGCAPEGGNEFTMSILLPSKSSSGEAVVETVQQPLQPVHSFSQYVRTQLPGVLLPPCPQPDTSHCTPHLYCHIASRRRALGPTLTHTSTPSPSPAVSMQQNTPQLQRPLPPHVPPRARSLAHDPGSSSSRRGVRSDYERQYDQLPLEARQARLHAIVAHNAWEQPVTRRASGPGRAHSAPAPPHHTLQSTLNDVAAAAAVQLSTPRTRSHASQRRPGLMPRSLSAHRLMRPRPSQKQSEVRSARSGSAGEAARRPDSQVTATSAAAATREQVTQRLYDDAVARLFWVYKQLAERHVEYHSVVPPTPQAATDARSSATLCTAIEERVHYSLPLLQLWRVLFHTGYLRAVVQCAQRVQRDMAGLGETPTLLVAAEEKITSRVKKDNNHSVTSRYDLQSASLRVRQRSHSTRDEEASKRDKALGQLLHQQQHTSNVPKKTATTSLSSVGTAALWLPMHPCDFRALVEILYRCGCRTHGYHVLVRMDFQHFRRLILLLASWETTATSTSASSSHNDGKKSDKGVEVAVPSSEKGENTTNKPIAPKEETQHAAMMEEAFGRVDLVPSLDALSARACMTAYQTAYDRIVQHVPGIKPYSPAATTTETVVFTGNTRSSSAHSAREGGVISSATGSHRGPSRGTHDELVATPPLSPIVRTQAAPSPQEAALHTTPSLPVDARSDSEKDKAVQGVSASPVTTRASAGVDTLLALLAANDKPLHELFQAYSDVVYVRRSTHYSAPRSVIATAAAASQQSSLIADVSCSSTPPRRGRDSNTGSATRHAGRSSVSDEQRQGQRQSSSTSTQRRAQQEGVRDGVTYAPQDILWKAQQLFTTSAEESARIGRRRHVALHVMRYTAFQQLFRAVDVFPGLISQALLQRAFIEALHTVLFDDNWTANTTSEEEEVRKTATPQTMSRAAVESAVVRHTGPVSIASSTTPSHASLQTSAHAHAGLTFLAFVEAFVRVALTVFSVDRVVDRVAFPTAAAKLSGLMRWVNKQVRLGYVAERTRTLNVANDVQAKRGPGMALGVAPHSTRQGTAHTFPPRLTLFNVKQG